MPPKVSRGFSFFGGGGSTYDTSKDDDSTGILKKEFAPCLKLQTDKEVYRPGDVVTAIVEISNPRNLTELSDVQPAVNDEYSFLIENLKFEVKGIEKLDTQWFATQKPLPGSKQRRGEQVFLDCTTPSIASKVMVSSGHAKTYIVRAELPKIIPPSYRGSSIRYLYYVRSMLSGYWLVFDNGHSNRESRKDLIQLEARAPLQIWVTQKTSGLLAEEGQTNGILPVTTVHVDIYWKEKDADSEWVRANEISDALEDGYESSRDEISSVSSYNPTKGIDLGFQNSLSLQSSTSRLSNAEAPYIQGERSNHPLYMTPPKLSVAEVSYDPGGDILSPRQKSTNSSSILSPSQQRRHSNSHFTDDDTGVPSTLGNVEPAASEGFIRGRSYNIRMDDQVLLRFSPKNSDSTYYFGDMIGGTLTFFHEEGARRCLEISITLEISETISQRNVHPSRRNSTTITKVQSDHYEIVADLVQTSFLFSIPVDGPMSFSTLHVSVHWALRFEFLTTPKYVDWRRYMPSGPSLPGLAAGSRWVILLMLSKNFDEKVEIFLNMYSFDVPPVDILSADVETWKLRYEHPLLIEGRDKSEWVLPIAVHAPPLRTQSAQAKNEKPLSLGALWVRS